jgi:hypothetical protein
MSKLGVVFVSVGFLYLLPFPVAVQEKSPDEVVAATVKQLDANNDGMITMEEFMAQRPDEELWKKLDTNQDGVLDTAEQKQGFTPKYRIVH